MASVKLASLYCAKLLLLLPWFIILGDARSAVLLGSGESRFDTSNGDGDTSVPPPLVVEVVAVDVVVVVGLRCPNRLRNDEEDGGAVSTGEEC